MSPVPSFGASPVYDELDLVSVRTRRVSAKRQKNDRPIVYPPSRSKLEVAGLPTKRVVEYRCRQDVYDLFGGCIDDLSDTTSSDDLWPTYRSEGGPSDPSLESLDPPPRSLSIPSPCQSPSSCSTETSPSSRPQSGFSSLPCPPRVKSRHAVRVCPVPVSVVDSSSGIESSDSPVEPTEEPPFEVEGSQSSSNTVHYGPTFPVPLWRRGLAPVLDNPLERPANWFGGTAEFSEKETLLVCPTLPPADSCVSCVSQPTRYFVDPISPSLSPICIKPSHVPDTVFSSVAFPLPDSYVFGSTAAMSFSPSNWRSDPFHIKTLKDALSCLPCIRGNKDDVGLVYCPFTESSSMVCCSCNVTPYIPDFDIDAAYSNMYRHAVDLVLRDFQMPGAPRPLSLIDAVLYPCVQFLPYNLAACMTLAPLCPSYFRPLASFYRNSLSSYRNGDRFFPETSLSDVRDALARVGAYICSIPGMLGTALRRVFTTLVSNVSKLSLVTIGSVVRDAVADFAQWITSSTNEMMNALLIVLVKTFIRLCFNYTPSSIIMEVFFENNLWLATSEFYQKVTAWFIDGNADVTNEFLNELVGDVSVTEAQSGVESPAIIGLLILGVAHIGGAALGLGDPKTCMAWMRDLSTAVRLGRESDVKGLFHGLSSWFDSQDSAAATNAWLQSVSKSGYNLMMFYLKTVGPNPISSEDKRTLHMLNLAYLNYRACVGNPALMSSLDRAMHPVTRWLAENPYPHNLTARRAPEMFLFAGPPGYGKSFALRSLATSLAVYLARRSRPDDPDIDPSTVSDYMYWLNATDKYDSAYQPTNTIWIMDEFLQVKDVSGAPSPDVETLFRCCTPAPLPLNKADVSSKGEFGQCHLLLGATNIPFYSEAEGFKNGILSSHLCSYTSAAAVRGRITWVVVPKCKPGYSVVNRVLMCNGVQVHAAEFDPGEYFDYMLFDHHGALSKTVSFKQLAEMVCKSYHKTARPVESATMKEIISPEFDPYSPEGWFDSARSFVGRVFYPSTSLSLDNLVKKECTVCRDPCDLCKKFYIDQVTLVRVDSDDDDANGIFIYECAGERYVSPVDLGQRVELDAGDFDAPNQLTGTNLTYVLVDVHDSEGKLCKFRKIEGVHRHCGYPSSTVIALIAATTVVATVAAYGIKRAIDGYQSRVIRLDEELTVRLCHDDVGREYYAPESGTRIHKVARRSFWVGSRRHVIVQMSDGSMRYYAESDEPIHAKVRPILQSLWAIASCGGALLGNLLVTKETQAVLPIHVYELMKKEGIVVLKKDDIVIVLDVDSENCSHMMTRVAEDSCVIEIFTVHGRPFRFPHGKTNLGRFQSSPLDCHVMFYYRDNNGILQESAGTLTVAVPLTLEYSSGGVEYKHESQTFRVDGPKSVLGACGGIYLSTHSTHANNPIIGHHLARSGATCAGAFLTSRLLDVSVSVPPNIPHGVFESEGGRSSRAVPVDVSEIEKSGLYDFQDSPFPKTVQSNGSLCYTTFFNDAMRLGLMKYGLPHIQGPELRISTTPDPVVSTDVLNNALEKLARTRDMNMFPVPKLEYLQIAEEIGIDDRAHFTDLGAVSWDRALGPGDIPSIDVSKAKGLCPGKGTTKACHFYEGTRVLIPEIRKQLDAFWLSLAPDDWATCDSLNHRPCIGAGSIKDEPVAWSKIFDAASRLFIVVNAFDTYAQRRAFYGLLYMQTMQNIAVESACGIAPQNWNEMFDIMGFVPGEHCSVLCADYVGMDRHVNICHIYAVCRYVNALYAPTMSGETRDLGILGVVDREGFRRTALLLSLGAYYLVLGDKMTQPGIMHPSGSTLTGVINWLLQRFNTTFALRKIFGDAERLIPRVFLGDDSIMRIPNAIAPLFNGARFVSLHEELGFEISDAFDKKRPPSLVKWNGCGVSPFVFLSRYFYDGRGYLDPYRLVKTVCFVEGSKAELVMPEQFKAFFEEYFYYYKFKPPIPGSKALHAFAKIVCQKYYVSVENICRFIEKEPAIVSRLALDILRVTPDLCVVYSREEVNGTSTYTFWPADGKPLPPGVDEPDDSDVDFPVLSFIAEGGDPEGGITQFDTTVECDTTSEFAPATSAMLTYSGMMLPLDVSAIFSRPRSVGSVLIDSASTGNVFSCSAPSVFFDGYANAQFKLANAEFYRGTMCFRVVTTAGPTSQGKFLISLRPIGRSPANVYEASGDPCVEIDAASGKTAEIRMPFVHPSSWGQVSYYGTADEELYFDFCQFAIHVMTPFRDTSAGSLVLNVFCWLEDLDLRGPTITTFTTSPQAGKGSKSESVDSTSSAPKAVDSAIATIRAVGGVVTDCAAWIWENKEMIATAAAFAASALSKPNIANNTTVALINPNFSAPHMIGNNVAIVLGQSQETKVISPFGIFSDSADQMDISTFVSRPGFVGSAVWNGSDLTYATVLSFYVNPGLSHIAGGSVYPCPVTYASQMFRFWRGELIYRLALSKTRFHSGLLEIIVVPGVADVVPTTDARSANCYRILWDIQESSELQFSVPYCSPLPWTPVYFHDLLVDTLPLTGRADFASGRVWVKILNPLRDSSGIASANVDVLVYQFAGPDFEFTTPMTTTPYLEPAQPFVAEGGGEVAGVFQRDATDGVRSSSTRSLYPALPITPMSRVTCNGERYVNFRALLKRYNYSFTPVTIGIHPSSTRFTTSQLTAHPFFALLGSAFSYATGGFSLDLVPGEEPRTVAIIGDYQGYSYRGDAHTCRVILYQSNSTFTVPYRHVVPFLPVNLYLAGNAPFGMRMTCTAATTVRVGVAGADDLNLGWQIGPPAFTVPVINPPPMISYATASY